METCCPSWIPTETITNVLYICIKKSDHKALIAMAATDLNIINMVFLYLLLVIMLYLLESRKRTLSLAQKI